MNIHAKANFQVTSWEQKPYDEPETGAKLLRADVKKTFQGEIEATSAAVLLMCQGENNGGGYVASERVSGRIGNRAGSFVIQHGGAMLGEDVTDSFGYIVPGSGTGELQGLRGHCAFRHEGEVAIFILDYEIA